MIVHNHISDSAAYMRAVPRSCPRLSASDPAQRVCSVRSTVLALTRRALPVSALHKAGLVPGVP